MKVALLVFPGVEELDFVGFLEVLSVANRIHGSRYFETELVGTAAGPIICGGGMKVMPDLTLAEMGEHDLLFVPGGGATRGIGVDSLMQDGAVLSAIRWSYEKGHKVWSVCTGALLLSKAGLLKGKKAVTHHNFLKQLEAEGALVSRKRVVSDERVTTGGGISSSIDLGLALVGEELGKVVETEVKMRMEYPPPNRSKRT